MSFFGLMARVGAIMLGAVVLVVGSVELRICDKGMAPRDFVDPMNWRSEVVYRTDDALLWTYELEHGRLAVPRLMGNRAAE